MAVEDRNVQAKLCPLVSDGLLESTKGSKRKKKVISLDSEVVDDGGDLVGSEQALGWHGCRLCGGEQRPAGLRGDGH